MLLLGFVRILVARGGQPSELYGRFSRWVPRAIVDDNHISSSTFMGSKLIKFDTQVKDCSSSSLMGSNMIKFETHRRKQEDDHGQQGAWEGYTLICLCFHGLCKVFAWLGREILDGVFAGLFTWLCAVFAWLRISREIPDGYLHAYSGNLCAIFATRGHIRVATCHSSTILQGRQSI